MATVTHTMAPCTRVTHTSASPLIWHSLPKKRLAAPALQATPSSPNASPACGPVPVTTVPASTANVDHTANSFTRRRMRGTTAPTRRPWSGSRERTSIITAAQTSTIDSTKCSCTRAGCSLLQTTTAPTSPCAGTPTSITMPSTIRSRRRGRRYHAASAANATPMETRKVNSRLICSIAACLLETSTTFASLQLGQSLHPRPDPVSRTSPPLTTMMLSSASAATQMVRNSVGVKPSARTRLHVERTRDVPCGSVP